MHSDAKLPGRGKHDELRKRGLWFHSSASENAKKEDGAQSRRINQNPPWYWPVGGGAGGRGDAEETSKTFSSQIGRRRLEKCGQSNCRGGEKETKVNRVRDVGGIGVVVAIKGGKRSKKKRA